MRGTHSHSSSLNPLLVVLFLIGFGVMLDALFTPPPLIASKQPLETILTNLVEEQDPGVALQTYSLAIQTDPSALEACHKLGHLIGKLAYAKYEDFSQAMQFQNDICGSGFNHGVIAAYINAVGPTIFSKYLQICKNNDYYCQHGVGHGLMFVTDNDLPRAVALCAKFGTLEERTACAEGVFMENFETDDESHQSLYLRPTDPYYPCSEYGTIYEDTCAYYSGRYHLKLAPGNTLGTRANQALTQCYLVTNPYACSRGVGSAIARSLPSDFDSLGESCFYADQNLRSACLLGGLRYYSLITYLESIPMIKARVCPVISNQAMARLCWDSG